MDEDKPEKLYPRLEKITPSAPIENSYIEVDPTVYRLQHIKDIKKYIEDNNQTRKSLTKRYSKINKGLHYTNYGLNTIATASGITSVSLLTTVVAVPISIALGGVSIGCSALSVIVNKLNKKFKSKESKHKNIHNLCEDKLNLLHSILSTALNDGEINEREFDIILKEEKHFRLRKEEIRRKNDIVYDEDSAKEKGKNELKESLLEPINILINAVKK